MKAQPDSWKWVVRFVGIESQAVVRMLQQMKKRRQWQQLFLRTRLSSTSRRQPVGDWRSGRGSFVGNWETS